MNPAVTQWIQQLADPDQAVAFYAYQSLQEEVLRTTEGGALAAVLGKELVAEAKPGEGGSGGPGSFRNNAFLTAAAERTVVHLHPARVRRQLARLLGYIPDALAVPYLEKALADLEAREMARQALESNPSEQATEALARALDAVGPEFLVGVVNSLGKRKGAKAAEGVRKAAASAQAEVRIAAVRALAEFGDPAHDDMIERATRSGSGAERRAAHAARVRLAGTVLAAGNNAAAQRIYRAIVAVDAPEPQKKAARLAVG
jgi:hypothetical protein